MMWLLLMMSVLIPMSRSVMTISMTSMVSMMMS